MDRVPAEPEPNAQSAALLYNCHLTLIFALEGCNCLRMQDYDLPHKLWLFGHKLLLGAYVVSHTLLHKAVPQLFAGPQMMPMIIGKKPYRVITNGMYQTGLVLAALLTVITAAGLRICVS